jgi:hypothetical protein
MNKRLFSLSIFAIALAAVFVSTVPSITMAASDNYNNAYVGSTNLFGVDEATSGITAPVDRDRDIDAGLIHPSYGLKGSWEPGQN